MVQSSNIILQEGINFKLLDDARLGKGWSITQTAEFCDVPEGTTKKILNGSTLNPGAENLGKLCRGLGVDMELVLRQPEKTKIENQGIKMGDTSILALKEIYELNNTALKEINEAHIANIRSHYEQHHEDLKENLEKRLSDKREIIEILKEENASLKKQLEKKENDTKVGNIIRNLIIGLFVIGSLFLLVLEFIHPEHGWIRFSNEQTPVGFIIIAAIVIIVLFAIPYAFKSLKRS